jgi:hypothetical protein
LNLNVPFFFLASVAARRIPVRILSPNKVNASISADLPVCGFRSPHTVFFPCNDSRTEIAQAARPVRAANLFDFMNVAVFTTPLLGHFEAAWPVAAISRRWRDENAPTARRVAPHGLFGRLLNVILAGRASNQTIPASLGRASDWDGRGEAGSVRLDFYPLRS